MSVGIGFDFHVWDEKNQEGLVLGGVKLDFHKGLKAHSDGDVVIHSLIDALLGAKSLGDIGELFPDTTEEWRNANSINLLKLVLKRLGSFKIINVDIVVILDEPRLGFYKKEMKKTIANLLSIKDNQVSVKAKTTEGIFTKGISAITVVEVMP